jgi:hypothetical protein
MADEKLTQIRVSAAFQTPLDGDDLFYVAQDTGTSPEGRAITGTELLAELGVTDGDKGDITKAGDTWTIENNAVTFAKMQAITDGKLLGASGGTAIEEITVGSGLSLSGNTLSATGEDGDYLSELVNAEVSITGTDTASWGKQHVVSGSSDFTVTLQTCSGHTGEFMSFRITNTGVTTLDGNSSETIEGATTIPCYQGQTITLYSDGSNAHVINQNAGNVQLWFSPLQFSSNFTKKYTVRTSQPYNFAMEQNSGAANGDWISVQFFAKKGSYTVSILGFTVGSCAKQDWSLNGVNQTTGQDWYSASTVYNVVKTFTMTVPYTGIHTLKSTLNGRNASASGWDFQLTAIAF